MIDQQLEDRLISWQKSGEKYDWHKEAALVRERQAQGLPVVYRMGVGYMDNAQQNKESV